jgi:hypothetical protein
MGNTLTEVFFDDGEYFVGLLHNGARVGMNGVVALDVPWNHALYPTMVALQNASDIENFIDTQVEAGRIDPRVFI